ncbi:hypothetical protein [Alicyclobacillus kakegawensis]|uniref:hypothetical protein n=1 Tax=Alicyclobacillus kakegawensis TaxID=392012 RepID=UPI00082FB57A|nr:hypothetical protein [Alicyclobacillus kakegawensis]
MFNPFDGMPEHVRFLAIPDEAGEFTVHVKINDYEFKTFPGTLDLRTALVCLEDARQTAGLPPESVLVKLPQTYLNRPDVDARRLKKWVQNIQ